MRPNKLKPGTKVRVKRSKKARQLTDELCSWAPSMDNYVGKIGKVTSSPSTSKQIVSVQFKDGEWWNYHKDSLTIIKKK